MKIVFASPEASNLYRGSGLGKVDVDRISEWLSDVARVGLSATIALPHPSDIVVVGVDRSEVWRKLSELYDRAAEAHLSRAELYKRLADQDDA